MRSCDQKSHVFIIQRFIESEVIQEKNWIKLHPKRLRRREDTDLIIP
jgi:hypothetical protein